MEKSQQPGKAMKPERRETDKSLNSERNKTDESLVNAQENSEHSTDKIVEKVRLDADQKTLISRSVADANRD